MAKGKRDGHGVTDACGRVRMEPSAVDWPCEWQQLAAAFPSSQLIIPFDILQSVTSHFRPAIVRKHCRRCFSPLT